MMFGTDPRTPPKASVFSDGHSTDGPRTPDSVLSPPRTVPRYASVSNSFQEQEVEGSPDSFNNKKEYGNESFGLGALSIEKSKSIDEPGASSCSVTSRCCPVSDHGPMRYSCSLNDTICSNCGVLQTLHPSSIGYEVVLYVENSPPVFLGTVIASQTIEDKLYFSVRKPDGSEQLFPAEELRPRVLEWAAKQPLTCDFHLCSFCYNGFEANNISNDCIPFDMSANFSELLWDAELVDSNTLEPLSLKDILSRKSITSDLDWPSASHRGINFMVLSFFTFIHLTPSTLMTRVVARKVLKNITREMQCPAWALFQGVSIKLVTGEVVPATANPEYFLSQSSKSRFIENIGTALKYFQNTGRDPASVFIFEPSICVNQWTEDIDVAANTYKLEEMPQSVEEAMISSQKVLLIQSMTTNDDYILDRLFQIFNVYNKTAGGNGVPFQSMPPQQQRSILERLFNDPIRQEYYCVLSLKVYRALLAEIVKEDQSDIEMATQLVSNIEQNEAKLLNLKAQDQHTVSEETHGQLQDEIERVREELDKARSDLEQTEDRIARELEERFECEKEKLKNDHGRETAERDASWERKHKEIQEQTEDRIVSELEERFESEREELRNHHGRETAERNALWEVKHKELHDRYQTEHKELALRHESVVEAIHKELSEGSHKLKETQEHLLEAETRIVKIKATHKRISLFLFLFAIFTFFMGAKYQEDIKHSIRFPTLPLSQFKLLQTQVWQRQPPQRESKLEKEGTGTIGNRLRNGLQLRLGLRNKFSRRSRVDPSSKDEKRNTQKKFERNAKQEQKAKRRN